jgi:parallel beta-helix repeat protein
VIAGNSGAAIVISGTATIDTTVAGNIIGLRKAASADTSYTVIADNGGEGVLVQSGPSDTTISANRIAGDDDDGTDFAGIRIAGSSTATTTISLNNIGWIPDQGEPPYLARPNADGIVIDGIAGPTEILTNVVRLNDGRGVYINNSDDVVVRSNTLAGNDDTGLLIRGDSDDIAVSENTIRDNGGYAVLVDDTSQRVSLRSNRMTGNTSGAIELDGTTIYSGTGTDSDALTLPNHGIDPPPFDDGDLADPLRLRLEQNGVVRGFVYTSTNRLETTLNPASACVTCTLQIFGPAEGVSDGQPFVWLQDVPNSQFAEDGSFVAQVFGALPNQLIVIATDGFGNSSEAVVLDVDHQLVLTPVTPVSAAQDAEPGQTVTYTLSLSNPGTIDYSNLQFTTAGTYASWIPARDPATNPLTLRSGEDRLLTVTLTLPTGADPFVQVPITDTTTVTVTSSGLVTATRDLQTTVLEKPILVAAPLQDSGSAVPSETVSYGHTITNTGNVTVTVDLTYNTVDPADSQRLWATTLNTDTLTLGPGLSADVLVTVQVPPGANVEDGQGNPVQATTYLTATARGYSGVTATFSDTTRVTLEPDATMIQDETQSGEAGQVVLLYHTVTNTGNGVTNFQLSYVANRGSTVEFVSDSDGITINENNVFSLDNVLDPPARTNTMRFVARITLNRDLLPGDEETINILLRNFDTGDAIGGATVVDRITIEAGEVRPRVWFPLLQVE